jgi:hypothetical protein
MVPPLMGILQAHTTRARTCAETYIPKGRLIGFRTCVNLLECIILCPRISNPNFQLNVYNYTLLKCSPYLPFAIWSSFVTPPSALPSITSAFHRQSEPMSLLRLSELKMVIFLNLQLPSPEKKLLMMNARAFWRKTICPHITFKRP